MNVIVDGLLTNYHRVGKGKVVLCLHGWGEGSSTFASLSESLGRNFTVLALDLPGFEATQPPPEAWGVEDYARFVGHFLDKLEIKKAYAVIGHSNGGAIAITALANGFAQASKLALVASAGIRNERSTKKSLYSSFAKLGKVATLPLPARFKKGLKNRFYNAIGSDITVLPHLEDTFRKVVSYDVQADATKIKLPALLIYGSEDLETPPRYGAILSEAIVGSRLEIVPGAGHFIHTEQPTRVSQLIEGFLREGQA